jgi:hypothetical protein
VEAAEVLLQYPECAVNGVDTNGKTALHWSCQEVLLPRHQRVTHFATLAAVLHIVRVMTCVSASCNQNTLSCRQLACTLFRCLPTTALRIC